MAEERASLSIPRWRPRQRQRQTWRTWSERTAGYKERSYINVRWLPGLRLVGWVLLYVHRNRRLFRDGRPGRPPRLSHSSWALTYSRFAWSDMVHGCMVYTERAEMAAVSCGTSYASAVSTPLRWILKKQNKKQQHKTSFKKVFTHVESHANVVSLLESGE